MRRSPYNQFIKVISNQFKTKVYIKSIHKDGLTINMPRIRSCDLKLRGIFSKLSQKLG